MKGYVVTLMNIKESVQMAERCIESARQYGVDVEMFPAVWKTEALTEMVNEGLTKSQFDESFSSPEAVIGNFVAQYRVWKKIAESGEPGIVLEHDAVFVGSIPKVTGDIVNFGKPSYGAYRQPDKPGEYPMFSKTGGYIPGAHGYYLTPKGAAELVAKAKAKGAAPCDLFLNKTMFPSIKEIYPWVIEARDEFSTIQKQKGCAAKHNYSKDYKIIQ